MVSGDWPRLLLRRNSLWAVRVRTPRGRKPYRDRMFPDLDFFNVRGPEAANAAICFLPVVKRRDTSLNVTTRRAAVLPRNRASGTGA